MKKVIDGKLYNTETARSIGCHTEGESVASFDYLEEELYRTKSGAYFLHGCGGPMTRYGTIGFERRSGGEKIMPLSANLAQKWAEENLDTACYIAELGEPEEAGNDRVALNTTITTSARYRLDRLRANSGKTYGDIISELLEHAPLE